MHHTTMRFELARLFMLTRIPRPRACRRRVLLLLAPFVALVAWFAADPRWSALAETPASQPALFSADRYGTLVETLASEAFGGRGVESVGSSLSAEMVVEKWKSFGLVAGATPDAWFQTFDVRSQKSLETDQAGLTCTGLEDPLRVGIDWNPLPYTTMDEAQGPLAFAGYGIDAPEYGYDDYLDIDPTGKVLMIFRYEPRGVDGDAPFGGREPSHFAAFREKAAMAKRLGAVALLVVNPPEHPLVPSDDLISFDAWRTRPTYDLPMAQVTQSVAEKMLKLAGLPDLRTLQSKLEQQRESQSADAPQVMIHLKPGVRPAHGRNIVGLYRGTDRSDEVIVVGAHYDHLGLRPRRDSDVPEIHNGADDNASGTAGLIELARALSDSPQAKRDILFVAFDGEELGLLGSRHFVDHPPVAVQSIKAMINFDMIGRFRPERFEISGMGTAAEFPDLVDRHAKELGLEVKKLQRVRRDSDQRSFDRAAVPTLFFHTGMHEDYHRPSDDSARINAQGAVQVLELARRVVLDLANLEAGPEYTLQEGATSQATGSAPAASAPSRQPSVRLGFTPSFEDESSHGVTVESVVEGGAGDKAGLKAGDNIIRVNDTPIVALDEYMTAMTQFKPGDTIQVVVLRGGAEETLKVTFDSSQRTRRASDPS